MNSTLDTLHSALKRLDFFLYFIVFSISQPTKIQVGCPICSHNSSNFMQLLSRAPAGHNTWWEFKLGSFFDTTAIKKCEDYKSLQGSRSLFYNIFAEVKKKQFQACWFYNDVVSWPSENPYFILKKYQVIVWYYVQLHTSNSIHSGSDKGNFLHFY